MHSENKKIYRWCRSFPEKFAEFSKNDRRRDVFCVPIILYISCIRNIDISKNKSIVSIYDEAFKDIAEKRKHNPNTDLKKVERIDFEVQWTYTKELAYQMSIINELYLKNNYVNIARNRTLELKANNNIDFDFEHYFAVFHFASKRGEHGVQFAHKTVSDYFTAVKIYEDYFEGIENQSTSKIWENIFQAFRYKDFSSDVFTYLIDLIRNRQRSNFNNWKDQLFDAYYKGMEDEILWKVIDSTEVKAYFYKYKNDLLSEQVSLAFCSLTRLLTGLAFDNKDLSVAGKKVLSTYISKFPVRAINLCNWNLINVNLCGAQMISAYLENADLKNAKLTGAHLKGAVLKGANLSDANLVGAHLNGAKLNGAKLLRADLSCANLIGADFSGTDLFETNLSNVQLWKRDLPKYDYSLKKGGIKFFSPIIEDLNDDEYYDPSSNRVKKSNES